MTDYSKIQQVVEESDRYEATGAEVADLLRWAITTIRELDEAGRSMIAGFDPMDSDDMGKLKQLGKLAEEFEGDA